MSIEQKDPQVQTQAAATQRRYRTLAVVKQEAITRVEKPLEDSVFVWPHLLVREFFAATTLNFLGLQELLHYFPPTSAGVLIPGFTLAALAALPYIDRNPSRAYADRKVAIVTFTMFLVFWAVITLAGSFFRGPGWLWVWPWQHIYFDL
jgi:menaquinol-cytochrome c reductase cytochrome b/c subunit